MGGAHFLNAQAKSHGVHLSTGEIALSAHTVSILRVYPCGHPMPRQSNSVGQVLLTFDGSPVPSGKARGLKALITIYFFQGTNHFESPHPHHDEATV